MSDLYLSINIGEPTKNTDSFMQEYISYKIDTQTNKTEFAANILSVNRRFSDFEWLSLELARLFPGCIVPALPDKQAVGRFTQEFIGARRRSLEKFIARIATHKEFSSSIPFIAFLEADTPAFDRIKKDAAAEEKRLAIPVAAWFDSKVNSVTHRDKGVIEKSTADMKIEEIAQYLAALDKQMQNVAQHSSYLVKRNKASASAIHDFGQSVTWLGQSEGDSLGAALNEVGTCSSTLSVAATVHAESENVELKEPIEEYVRLMSSVRKAMSQRNEKKNNYITSLTDLEAKKIAHIKVVDIPGKEESASKKEKEVVAAQESVEKNRAEFELVSNRLLSDFEDFKKQKAFDIRNIVLNFINLQIEYNKKSEDVWSSIVPKLQEISGGNGSDTVPSAPPASNTSDIYAHNEFLDSHDEYEGV